jgi:hypothetical protein
MLELELGVPEGNDPLAFYEGNLRFFTEASENDATTTIVPRCAESNLKRKDTQQPHATDANKPRR